MPKELTLYAEKYRKGAARVKSHLNPITPHVDAEHFTVREAFLLEAGRVRCAEMDIYIPDPGEQERRTA